MAERKSWKADVRAALAEYVYSEGCSCCQDRDAHAAAAAKLGKLLGVAKYVDGSGYDFTRYRVLITVDETKKKKGKVKHGH